MIAIKFDEEKVKHCIQAYKDEHGKNPRLLMSEKTVKILPMLTDTLCVTTGGITSSLTFSPTTPTTPTTQDDNFTHRSWNNCKILIDNDLEFGEVHIS